MANCSYVHRFIRFPGGEAHRPCVLDKGHPGNHVVIEPRMSQRLEVLRDGSQQRRGQHGSMREYLQALFPSKDFS